MPGGPSHTTVEAPTQQPDDMLHLLESEDDNGIHLGGDYEPTTAEEDADVSEGYSQEKMVRLGRLSRMP